MHVMIDLETMGTQANAAIVAIGACFFDATGIREDNTFYRTITLKSAMDSGADVDPDTVLWWMKQDREAQREIIKADTSIWDALNAFNVWIRRRPYKGKLDGVWGNGASFDNVLLATSYARIGSPVPWQFWMDRCYRTKKAESPVPLGERTGTHHNALDDAMTQAKHLIEIWRHEAKG